MSERGTVLKENQNLFDKNDSLRKELEKILKSRDDYVKECESLRQKLDVIRSRSEFMQSNDDLFSSKDKKTFLSLEGANQEIENQKKKVEKGKLEVAKAIQELEIAKGRRDWAITEREKIVQERDSVRNLCDELRKERDTATSKLLAAIRDKDEAFKNIEQLNERIDALSNAKKTSDAHDHHKKRIDSEDEIEVDVRNMLVNADLGVNLVCANENSDYNGNSIYPQVVFVEPSSVFFGKLHTNDYIQCVNGIDCSTLSQRMLFKTIRTSAPTCKLIVKRSNPIPRGIYNVQIQLTNNSNHGVTFDTGVYVAEIEPNSVAYYEPLISVGDRVLQINEKSVEGIKNVSELNQIIMNIKNNEKLSLKIMKDGKTGNGISATSLNRAWSKMANCSTQTDQSELTRRSIENNYLPIVPFVPSSGMQDSGPEMSISMSSSSPNSSKSASSKLSGMLQIIRKFANSNKDNQENDAIKMLDSVLDSQDSLDTARDKTKKSKHQKNIAKSWPRTAMVMRDSGKSHSGTVVINRTKDRPRLYLIPTDDQPNFQVERKENAKEKITSDQHLKTVNAFFAPPPPIASRTNRNSNPLPNSHMTRNLAIPPRSILPSASNNNSYMSPLSSIYEPVTKSYNNKRHSLNLSSSGNKPHFAHNSFIPIKPSNSIESTSMSKSPMETPKEDGLEYTSSKMNKYFSNYLSSSKYECTSDGENLSSSGGVSQQDSLNNTSVGTIPSHLRMQSAGPRVHGSPGLYPNPYLASRYTSPLPFPPNDGSTPSHDLNLSSSLHNSQNSSIDYSFPSKVKSQLSREEMSVFHGMGSSNGGGGGSYQESGTYPRNKPFRMPSNQVGIPIVSKPTKISNNSLDYCGTPDRSSPMPTFQIQIVEQGRNVNKRNSMPEYGIGYKPKVGEQRRVHIDKSEKPLGINIRCRNNRGVFVSHVGENSIASQVGIRIGDQLLEFCGINFRLASYDIAAKFLRQCGNSITMLVQYNPDKYDELSTSDENVSRSDDSTPQNSPKVTRSVMSADSIQNVRMSSLPPQESSHSTGTLKTHRHPINLPMTQGKSASLVSSNSNQLQHMMAGNTSTLGKEQPRVIYIETR
jgi:discs large protein 5